MVELETVLSNYLQTKKDNARVPGPDVTPALKALRQEIPDLLKGFISNAGYNLKEFGVKGSAGQTNFSFAKVPWIAIFKKTITTSAQNGYYIVLLFSEDMSSVSVSLCQGYTAFKERYIYPELAYEKLRDCAKAAVENCQNRPSGFLTVPIDLHSDGDLANGYEAGVRTLNKIYANYSRHMCLWQQIIQFL
jgi:5-methylcytosine-specific restriction protein A